MGLCVICKTPYKPKNSKQVLCGRESCKKERQKIHRRNWRAKNKVWLCPKQKTRNKTLKLILKKNIQKVCEICGSDKHIESHHEDYKKPMEVKFLCRKHHLELHKLNGY